MNRLHRLLRWLRLEDGEGCLSFTGVTFYLGTALTAVSTVRQLPLSITALTFLAGLAAHFGKKALAQQAGGAILDARVQGAQNQHEQALEQIKADASVKTAAVSADAAALKEQVVALTKAVTDLATPERVQAVSQMLNRQPAAVPQRFQGL